MDVKGLGPGARASGPTADSSLREKFFTSDVALGESRAAFQVRVLEHASENFERPIQEISFTSQGEHLAGTPVWRHYATILFEE